MVFDSVLLSMYIRARCLARLLNIAIQLHSFFICKTNFFLSTTNVKRMLHVVYYLMPQIVYVSI